MSGRNMSTLHILWDESHIWGLLVWRAAEALGLPYRLVKGEEIAHGLLSCNPPALLLVPGGTARLKAEALGPAGMAAIRDYVAAGGHYLGFCGGAGLGLSGAYGLGLCPWSRAAFTDRMQHFVSGHIHASVQCGHPLVPSEYGNGNRRAQGGTARKEQRHASPAAAHPVQSPVDRQGACAPHREPHPAERAQDEADQALHTPCAERRTVDPSLEAAAGTSSYEARKAAAPHSPVISEPLLPIWWPGRFAPEADGGIEVLASYTQPGSDFWVADLPLDTLPPGTFTEWETLYGIHLRPTFLEGQPCILHGNYGKGSYTLSYSHLETPGSPAANRWLVHLVENLTGDIKAMSHEIPAWDLDTLPVHWHDAALLSARAILDDIVHIGIDHSLLFRRNAWLIGWRAGIPGANLNNLHAAICTAVSIRPGKAALHFWEAQRDGFMRDLDVFHRGVTGYLLAERLAMTLSKTFPEAVTRQSLKEQRAALFGPPMSSGGLYLRLLETLDTLTFLCLQPDNEDRR